MPNKKDHCVDIQLAKGHPIKFLEFCSDFIGSLKLYLQEQKKLALIFNNGSVSSGNNLNSTKSKSASQNSGYNGNFISAGFYDFQLKTNTNFCKSNVVNAKMDCN